MCVHIDTHVCVHTHDTCARTHTHTLVKSITYAKEKWARAKLLKEGFEARSDDVWKTCHKSLFKQRTSTEGWNKSENKGNESTPSLLCVYGFLIHSKDRKKMFEIYGTSKSKISSIKLEFKWNKSTLILNEVFYVKHNDFIL